MSLISIVLLAIQLGSSGRLRSTNQILRYQPELDAGSSFVNPSKLPTSYRGVIVKAKDEGTGTKKRMKAHINGISIDLQGNPVPFLPVTLI
jgi:hypothetical protein